MKAIHFHVIWVPIKGCFVFKFDHETWELTPKEFLETIKHAESQLVDATDAVIEYEIKAKDWVFKFKNGREAFSAITHYFRKVYDSWRNYGSC